MAQTSYSTTIGAGVQGQLASQDPHTVKSYLAEVDMPFGVGLAKGAADNTCKVPVSLTAPFIGVSLSSFAHANTALSGANGIPQYDAADVLTKGVIYVVPESNVDPAKGVYCRATTKGGNTQLGSFRADADGTAQVTTMTPTAVNSTEYQLVVDGRFYGYTSDSSATAAEIVTGLAAAITADAGATVTPTGTTTLILTAKTAGVSFVAQGDANMAFAATTPNAATAFLVPNARWLSTTLAAGLATLELNIP